MPARIVRGVASPASTDSLSSFFDLGSRSAVRIFAVRNSTFMKSSIVIKASPAGGAAATGASVAGVPATSTAVVASVVSGVGVSLTTIAPLSSIRGQSAPSFVVCVMPPVRQVASPRRTSATGRWSPMRRRISAAEAGMKGCSNTPAMRTASAASWSTPVSASALAGSFASAHG